MDYCLVAKESCGGRHIGTDNVPAQMDVDIWIPA